jgi:hypothetical protein
LRKFSFAAATSLAICGILIAVYGITEEHTKPIAIGLILIFGAGVFATLNLGSRPRIEH